MTHQPLLDGFEEVFHAPSSAPHHDLLQFPKLDAETLRYHGKKFGRAGELLVESVFLSLGVHSVGVAEHLPFDCVVFLEQGVLRVQVKTATRQRAGCFNFNVSRGYHRSPGGVRGYAENDYDLLALVCLSENVVKFSADRRRAQVVGIEEVERLRRQPGASFVAALSALGVDQMAPAPAGPVPFCY